MQKMISFKCSINYPICNMKMSNCVDNLNNSGLVTTQIYKTFTKKLSVLQLVDMCNPQCYHHKLKMERL